MESKEKAKELFQKMYYVDDPMGNYSMCFETAKKCALIAVDEIIDVIEFMAESDEPSKLPFWKEVKAEIETSKLSIELI